MASQPEPRLTPEQYLEMDRKAEYRSEYLDGEVSAMSPANLAHGHICVNISTSLNVQLRNGPCGVQPSDVRVLVNPTGLYTYPDVSVVCGEPELLEGGNDTLRNPVLIVEVLSPSSEAYDRGLKFEHYRAIESLRQYLLVASNRVHMDLFTRQSGGEWLLTSAAGADDQLVLASIGCTLQVSDVYNKVDLRRA
jgi:Uma2 family endonuclease